MATCGGPIGWRRVALSDIDYRQAGTNATLLMLVVARSATAAQARLLLQPLQRAGVQPVLWLAELDDMAHEAPHTLR